MNLNPSQEITYSAAGSSNLLFVYGTLRKSIGHPSYTYLSHYSDFVHYGWFPGHLYVVNNYPGAIFDPNSQNKIFGEIYQCPAIEKLLRRLDHYEECSEKFPKPHEYIRRQLPINLTQNQVTAWVYLYNYPTEKLRLIESGDYPLYLSKTSRTV